MQGGLFLEPGGGVGRGGSWGEAGPPGEQDFCCRDREREQLPASGRA